MIRMPVRLHESSRKGVNHDKQGGQFMLTRYRLDLREAEKALRPTAWSGSLV